MRYALLSFALFIGLSGSAQSGPFRGTIVYEVKEKSKEGGNPKLTAHFGDRAIRLTFEENDKTDNEMILIRFDSASVFTLHAQDSSYRKSLIKTKPVMTFPPAATIAGQRTVAKELNASLGFSMSMLGTMAFYVSDLSYPVPKELATAEQLIMIQGDRIVLGALVGMGREYMPEESGDTTNTAVTNAATAARTFDQIWADPDYPGVRIKAIEVTRSNLPATLFQVPAYYHLLSTNEFPGSSDMMIDSVTSDVDTAAAEIDTVELVPPVIIPMKPVPPPPPAVPPGKKRKKSGGSPEPMLRPDNE